jgi:pimeloyl-ACP methyl ester carboxylesterase
LAITKGVVEYFKDDVWIVGHSLGGCITTYLASQIDEDPRGERVKFATFNGLGIAASMADEMSSERRNICARRLTNVYCTEDPVFNMHQFTRWTGIPPRHFGRSYFIKYRDPDNKIGAIDELMWYHGMDEMCCQIKYYCPKFRSWQVGVIVLLVIILLLGSWVLIRFGVRFSRKMRL